MTKQIYVFAKINGETYITQYPENTSVSIQELIIKSYDKFFSKNGYKSILNVSSSDKNNFIKACYFYLDGKHYSFSNEYYFDTNELSERTIIISIKATKLDKFDEYTLHKINEVMIDE